MIDGEATVKTLEQSDGHIWLMPLLTGIRFLSLRG
jgi:SOS-response transcriptional repressor LexA